MKKQYILFILWILIVPLCTIGQNHVFRNYSVNDGLPSSQVYSVLQDKYGYMWFATDRGVTRFNGYEFEVFPSLAKNGRNAVFQMQKDEMDRVWFSVMGQQLFYYENEEFVSYKYNEQLLALIKNRGVILFHCDSSNTLWVSLSSKHSGKEVLSIDSNGSFTFHKGHTLFPKMKELAQASRDEVFASKDVGNEKGYEQERQELYRSIFQKEISYGAPQRFFKHYYILDGVLHAKGFLEEERTYLIPGMSVNSLTLDKKGNLWFGVLGKGAFLFENGDLSNSPKLFLPGKSVTSIFEDEEGGYWFTTLHSGVYYLSNVNSVLFDSTSGLEDNYVSSIYGDKDQLFFGHSTGRITQLMRNDKAWEVRKHYSGFGNIYSFASSKNCRGVILSNSKGSKVPDGFNTSQFKCYLEKGDTTFIVSKRRELITKYSGVTIDSYQLPSINPMNLCFSEKFGLLISTIQGLYAYKNGVLKKLSIIDPLFDRRIQRIEKINGWYVMATLEEGMIFWNEEVLFQLTKEDGLNSNTCNNFFIENSGTIWVCTNKGINKVSLDLEKREAWVSGKYSLENGLVSNETLSCYSDSKYVWIATRKGVNRIAISSLKMNRYPSPIYIINSKLGDTEFNSNVSVNHRQNTFRVRFVGLSYRSLDRLHYEYRLIGSDNEGWMRTEQTELTYVNLGSGDYSFEVRAIGNGGVKSTVVARRSFTIQTPFWRTFWFYALIVIAIVLLLLTANFLNIKRIKKRERLLKELDRYKDNVLRAQMNPHFIYNSLNTIQSFILVEDSRQSMTYLSKFSKLMRMTFRNSNARVVKLKDDLEALKIYADLEKIRYPGSLEISFHVDHELETALVPPLLFQPFLENAILHGVLPGKIDGEISIVIRMKENQIHIRIQDNGIGFDAAKRIRAKKLQSAIYRSRVKENSEDMKGESGLSITKKRILQHNIKHKHGNTGVQIDSTERGTIVRFSLPLIKPQR